MDRSSLMNLLKEVVSRFAVEEVRFMPSVEPH